MVIEKWSNGTEHLYKKENLKWLRLDNPKKREWSEINNTFTEDLLEKALKQGDVVLLPNRCSLQKLTIEELIIRTLRVK